MSGAGDWGTDKARNRLQADTPGQKVGETKMTTIDARTRAFREKVKKLAYKKKKLNAQQIKLLDPSEFDNPLKGYPYNERMTKEHSEELTKFVSTFSESDISTDELFGAVETWMSKRGYTKVQEEAETLEEAAMSKPQSLEDYAKVIAINPKERQWIMDNEDAFGKYHNNSALKKSWLSLSYPIYDGDYYFAFIGDSERVNAQLNAEANRKLKQLAKSKLDNEEIFIEMSKLFEMSAYMQVGAGDTMTRDELWRAILHIRKSYKEETEIEETYRKPTAAEIAADRRKDNKSKDTSDRYRNMKKKVYGNMMGGLKKEESQEDLDEKALMGNMKKMARNLLDKMRKRAKKITAPTESVNVPEETLDEMTNVFVFDKAAKLSKAEKLADRFKLTHDSETQGNYYYLSITGDDKNVLKWMKATSHLQENAEVTELETLIHKFKSAGGYSAVMAERWQKELDATMDETYADEKRARTKRQLDTHAKRMNKSARDSIQKYEKDKQGK